MYYIHKKYSGIEMRDNNSHLVSFIEYSLHNSILHIITIERSAYARRCYSCDFHFGTDIFNALLLYLEENNIKIDKITGKLSYYDTVNKNWNISIPFYVDFSCYLDTRLPYVLSFRLFSNSDYTHEIIVPSDWNDRYLFIKDFTAKHNRSCSGASFCYNISRF